MKPMNMTYCVRRVVFPDSNPMYHWQANNIEAWLFNLLSEKLWTFRVRQAVVQEAAIFDSHIHNYCRRRR